MPTGENALDQYEGGQNLVEYEELEDQGDHKDFRGTGQLWSKKSGCAPVVRPNGIITGGNVTPAASAGNDKVDVAALTCYLAGASTSVAASADVTVTRPTGGSPLNSHNKHSITINASGVLTVVKGEDGTEFSSIRGAAGGPPWIPSGSIERCQIWLSSATPAAITAAEIKQVPGTHFEKYNYPIWTVKAFNVANGVIDCAGILFSSALPLIHSDDSGSTVSGKKVYAQYFEPIFSDIEKSENFVAPETTHSQSSKPIYRKTLGSKSSSLSQGSFVVYLEDGVTDPIVQEDVKNQFLFFKHFPDQNNTPYVLCQGTLGIGRTWPAGDQIAANCTITAEEPSVDVTG